MQSESPLRVLFITAWDPVTLGGVFVQEHAKAAALYDEIAILHCMNPDPKLKALWRLEEETDAGLTQGLPTYRVWHRAFTNALLRNWASFYGTLRAYRRIVAQGFRPQVLHAHVYSAAFHAVLIGKLFRLPVVATEHLSEFPRRTLSKRSIRKARFAFRRATLVTPVSESLKRAIESYGIPANFRVVPNVIDTKLFHPGRPARSGDMKRLLLVCLLDESDKKGVPDLFHALQSLRQRRDDWHLDIVGDGPGRAKHEQAAIQLGIADQVTFHGIQPRPQVAEFMRRADFLVVPSRFETFSVVAAEALATGTPVLATRCGGPEEFVTDDCGLVIPPGDSHALEKGLEYMLEHAGGYSHEALSRYAAARFSPEQVGKQLHEVYSTCVGARRAGLSREGSQGCSPDQGVRH